MAMEMAATGKEEPSEASKDPATEPVCELAKDQANEYAKEEPSSEELKYEPAEEPNENPPGEPAKEPDMDRQGGPQPQKAPSSSSSSCSCSSSSSISSSSSSSSSSCIEDSDGDCCHAKSQDSRARMLSTAKAPTVKKVHTPESRILQPEGGQNMEPQEDKEQAQQRSDGTEETKGAARGSRKRSYSPHRSSLSGISAGGKKTKRHPSAVPKIAPCVVDGCDYRASTKSNMVKHVSRMHKDVEGALQKARKMRNREYLIDCERCGAEIKINHRVRHASKCPQNEVDDEAQLAELERLAKSAGVDPTSMPWVDVLYSFKSLFFSAANISVRGVTVKQYWSQLVKFLEWVREQNPHFNPLLCMRADQDFPSFEDYLEAKKGLISTGCLIHLICGYIKACSLINDELVRVAQGDPTKKKTAIDLGSLITLQRDFARATLKNLKSTLRKESKNHQDKDMENVYSVLEVVKLWLDSNERKELMEEGEKHKFKVRHPLQFLAFNLLRQSADLFRTSRTPRPEISLPWKS